MFFILDSVINRKIEKWNIVWRTHLGIINARLIKSTTLLQSWESASEKLLKEK